jgi:hypothetical protein
MKAGMKLVKAKSEAVVALGNEAFVDPIETELKRHIRVNGLRKAQMELMKVLKVPSHQIRSA